MAPVTHLPSPPTGENRGPILKRTSIAVYVLALVVVGLRFFTRGWVVRKFGLDDCFIFISVVLAAVQTATIILQVKNGRGRHVAELSIDQINNAFMYKWINFIVYFMAIWAVKMSILALYHRIGHGRRGLPWILHSKVVWSIAIFITMFTISIVFAEIFACTPVSRSWDAERLPKGCFFAAAFNITQASINVVTDLILLIFPMPLIPLLQINQKQRFGLVIIISIGLIPLAASIIRLCEVIASAAAKGEPWLHADTTWKWAFVPLWSQIEVDVGIVAASLPSLNPLLKQTWSELGPPAPEPFPSQHRAQKPEPNPNPNRKMFFYDAREAEGEIGIEAIIFEDPEQAVGITKTAGEQVTLHDAADSQKSDTCG